jgi:hypothetical protein
MKKSQLRSLIRECIREVIKEEEETSIPKSVETADKKMTDLAKLVKQLPDDLKAKLVKKIKTAQGDVNSYIDDLKSEKEEEK